MACFFLVEKFNMDNNPLKNDNPKIFKNSSNKQIFKQHKYEIRRKEI